jgi:hypothetical protein
MKKKAVNEDDPLGILQDDDLLVGEGLWDYFSPRDAYNNTSKRTLEQLGKGQIKGITLSRAPIKGVLTKALDFISMGKFSELKKKYGFDKFYHLSMLVDLDLNGTRRKVVVEKNAVIHISASIKTESDAEYLMVSVTSSCSASRSGITLDQLMDKTKQSMGGSYFPYDAFKINCQVFIDSVLKANGLLSAQAHTWLFQNIEQLAKDMPEVSKQIASAVTTTGAVVDRLVGNGQTPLQIEQIVHSNKEIDELIFASIDRVLAKRNIKK